MLSRWVFPAVWPATFTATCKVKPAASAQHSTAQRTVSSSGDEKDAGFIVALDDSLKRGAEAAPTPAETTMAGTATVEVFYGLGAAAVAAGATEQVRVTLL